MSGSGTAGDPFVPVLILSEDADNVAECRDDGLYVPTDYFRAPSSATVATSQGTTSDVYADLATVGPSVSLTTLTTVLVVLTASMANSVAGTGANVGFAVSGATTLAANNTRALSAVTSASYAYQMSAVYFLPGLTAGINTFTAKYRRNSGAGTANFLDRNIMVIPLGV